MHDDSAGKLRLSTSHRSKRPATADSAVAEYQIIISKEPGGYVARVPDFPGIVIRDRTMALTRAAAREAIAIAIVCMGERGWEAPAPVQRRSQLNLRLHPDELGVIRVAARRRGFSSIGAYARAVLIRDARLTD